MSIMDAQKLITKLINQHRMEPLEIAYKVGVSVTTVYAWKNGSTKPSRRHEQKLQDLQAQQKAVA